VFDDDRKIKLRALHSNLQGGFELRDFIITVIRGKTGLQCSSGAWVLSSFNKKNSVYMSNI